MLIKPGQIIIKDDYVFQGLLERRFDPMLVEVMLYIVRNFGAYVTESYREKRHMNDLHGVQPVKAIDLRYRVYTEETAWLLEQRVNSVWSYDYKRLKMDVALLHGEGLNKHFHIQTHPRTRRN